MDKNLTISFKTIIMTALVAGGVYLLYLVKPVIYLLIISLIIVISLEHPIKFLMRQKLMNKPISRGVAVFITYLGTLLSIVILLTIGLPPVLMQVQRLVLNLGNTLVNAPIIRNLGVSLTDIIPQASKLSEGFLVTTVSIVSNIFSILGILVMSIYMSIDWENLKKQGLALLSGNRRKNAEETIVEVETSIGHWVKGQLFLMLVIGVVSFVALALLGIDYPLALGLISGLLEVVPLLGPIVAAILATVVGFSDSVPKGIMTLGVFIIIQQIENSFLVPKVMNKVSGFSSLIILILLLVGTTLFGIVGALVIIPLTMIVMIIVKRFLHFSPPRY